MSENFSNWNWVVLVLYLGGVFAIGIKARKHQKSSEDFFLAGRSMGYLPLGLSMCMTLFRGCAKIKWHFAVFSSGQWCSSRPEVLSGWIGESL